MVKIFNISKDGVPEGAVRVDRSTTYGNPFPVWKYGRDLCLANYENWIERKIREDPAFHAQMILDLKGRDLVCFCAPLACHAEILARIVNAE